MPDLAAKIAAAREAIARATPGPWEANPSVEAISEEPCLALMTPAGGDVDMKTAALLVPLAVNSLPALLDAVEAAADLLDLHEDEPDRPAVEVARLALARLAQEGAK